MRILDGIVEDESILPDDYPVYAGYLYVADSRVIQSDIEGNIKRLKLYGNYKEIRRCNISARGLW